MFDKTKLKRVIENYKQDFYPYLWEKGYDEEQFKWIAVKTFQKHWDINAENFPSMLESALSDTKGLLDIGMKYPRSMITGFAGDDAERVRAMFLDLFDESRDIVERISAFKHNSEELLKLYGNGAKNHYQDENTITTYMTKYDRRHDTASSGSCHDGCGHGRDSALPQLSSYKSTSK
ncbi:MAG: hypothetical protein LIO92_08695 [Clostridiales bacterium]|nr:hypothetical protein [Clostridiales bacterium]